MRIVCFSDVHNHQDQLEIPDGDILIFAGDAAWDGTLEEMESFARWFRKLPHPNKIFVAGNHDNYLEDHPEVLGEGVTYLLDREVTVGGLRIYGSPYRTVPEGAIRRRSNRWCAFSVTETWARHIWSEIPAGLDILVTHTPPRGILDLTERTRWGSQALIDAVRKKKPKYHIFGHVHDCPGVLPAWSVQGLQTCFVNVACCTPEGFIRPEIRVLVL